MFHLFSTVFHYVGIDRCFMDMHRLTTKISDAVCRTVLRKSWYPPTANMNFLRNPSTHFSLLLVTVMTAHRTKNHFRYSVTEDPVKETSPLLLEYYCVLLNFRWSTNVLVNPYRYAAVYSTFPDTNESAIITSTFICMI